MQPLVFLLLAALPLLTSAHGYLSSPPPRGIQKATYDVDDLKSPNHKGICRGEPVGQITRVRAGQSLTLGLTTTAPHIGPCSVTLLDTNLANPIQVADKMNCAAPGNPGFWKIQLPSGLTGRKVLRWSWTAQHVTPNEPYEQCVDLDFGGGNGPAPSGEVDDEQDQLATPSSSGSSPSPSYSPSSPPPPSPTFSQPPVTGASPSSDTAGNAVSFSNSGEPAPYTSSGSCSAGSYECTPDGGFNQCANGAWVKMGCPASTSCQQNGNQIACGMAAQ